MLHLKRVLTPPALRQPYRRRRRGAPDGNRNAFKHGRFTRERRALYADIRAYIAEARALSAKLTILTDLKAREEECSDAEPRRTRSIEPSLSRTAPNDEAKSLRASA